MAPSAWLEQAQDGDSTAIAALLNQSLQPKGIHARAERQSYCLQLWLTGNNFPPQATLVTYLRRAIERMEIPSIGILQIYADPADDPAGAWQVDLSLLASASSAEATSSLPRGDSAFQLDGGTGAAVAPAQAVPPVSPPVPAPPPVTPSGISSGISSGIPDGVDSLPATIRRAYQELRLNPGDPLPRVESVYFKTKAELLRRGDRAALEPLKWAYDTLKDYLEAIERQPLTPVNEFPSPDLSGLNEGSIPPDRAPRSPSFPSAPTASPPYSGIPTPDPALALQTLLQERGLPAQVHLQEQQLHIRWPAVRVVNPKQATAQIYTLLTQQNLDQIGLGTVETLVVAGLNSRQQAVWQQTLAMPQRASVVDDTDLMSFNNRYSNGIVFPALMGLGMLMNVVPLANALLWGIKVWIHEFGHATIAWLSGRQAIPLPIGWTNVNPQRSVWVYLGVLILLGLLYWSGQREQKRWPMVLAGVLIGVQFAMTWLMSPRAFDMWLAFGGIGGELYLSTLLMVSFFFPMPAYWRWDFYRYPVVIGAAFTFWGQFGLWKRIRWGGGSIPFGMMWGDAEHGDMNILANRHGWTPGDIISTYNGIANLCLLALLGVYGYVLYRQHRHWFLGLRQRWLA